jgi:hypothetical protein
MSAYYPTAAAPPPRKTKLKMQHFLYWSLRIIILARFLKYEL